MIVKYPSDQTKPTNHKRELKMTVKITDAEQIVMAHSLYNMPVDTLVHTLNATTKYSIHAFSPHAINHIFKSPFDAIQAFHNLDIKEGDYFFINMDNKVIVIRTQQSAKEVLGSLSTDITTLVDEVFSGMSPDFAEQYDLPLCYISEAEPYDFLECNLHLISESKIREIIETEIFAKNILQGEIANKDEKLVVRFKNSNFHRLTLNDDVIS